MHQKNIIAAGKALKPGGKVLIMLHGRGGTAEDALSLSGHLHVDAFTLLAPQAAHHTWYPYSFLAPPAQNEPWLSAALALLNDMVKDLNNKGTASEDIYFSGFSQGACLALEFAARNATKWGGIAAFTGGLIGDTIYGENYSGDFGGTPVFIGAGNPDPHVPVARVQATTKILKSMNAAVTEKIYAGMGHTITQDEIDEANKLIFDV